MRPMSQLLVFLSWKERRIMEYTKDFESYLRNNGKADKTVESYTGDVAGYIRFLKSNHYLRR